MKAIPDLRFGAMPIMTVLVVDDEKAIGALLERALTQYGLAVLSVTSGQQAVETYRERHQTISVVLLDVQMPGLDGPVTLSALQAINPTVRCCFMSGNTGKYEPETLLSMGAGHVLPKPFPSLAEVAAVLQRLGEG